jgi:hypothetical protein
MRLAPHILLIALVLASASRNALADGGQVRSSEVVSDYRVTVFTSPQPLRAGPIDVSVLIQHAETGEVAADAKATVELVNADKSAPPLRAMATPEAATNKLLRAALFELPAAGKWTVAVNAELPDGLPRTTRFSVEAAPPLPAWLTLWPWMAWPVVAIVLFVIHRRLAARQRERRGKGGSVRECGRVASPVFVELSPLLP